MIIECAWHEKYFNKVKLLRSIAPFSDTRTSHGICSDCRYKMFVKAQVQDKQKMFDEAWEEFVKILP